MAAVPSLFPAIVLLMLAVGLAGCGDSGPSTPSAPGSLSQPSPTSTPTPNWALTVFTDSATGFSTTDLRDVQEQIVQLNSIGELIWTVDGTRLPGYRVTHPTGDGKVLFVEGKICPEGCAFEVRFGTRDGGVGRSSRRLRKMPRRRRGMVRTTCRCATGARTSFWSHSAHRSCRL